MGDELVVEGMRAQVWTLVIGGSCSWNTCIGGISVCVVTKLVDGCNSVFAGLGNCMGVLELGGAQLGSIRHSLNHRLPVTITGRRQFVARRLAE